MDPNTKFVIFLGWPAVARRDPTTGNIAVTVPGERPASTVRVRICVHRSGHAAAKASGRGINAEQLRCDSQRVLREFGSHPSPPHGEVVVTL